MLHLPGREVFDRRLGLRLFPGVGCLSGFERRDLLFCVRDRGLQPGELVWVLPLAHAHEFPFEKPAIAFRFIGPLLQDLLALGAEVIDAERLKEPLLSLPRRGLKEGQKILLARVDGVFEVHRAHAERPAHFCFDRADALCHHFSGPVELRIVLDGLSLPECPHDRVLLPTYGKVEPDLAPLFWRCKT